MIPPVSSLTKTCPSSDEIVSAVQAAANCTSIQRLARKLRVDLDDAVSGAVLRLIVFADRYDSSRGPFRHYAIATLRNVLYDLGRERKRHQTLSLSSRHCRELEVPDRRQQPIDAILIAREETDREDFAMQATLENADQPTRQVVRLHRQGHTFAAIAQGLALPVSRVARIWYTWVAMVRQQQDECRA